MDLIIQVPKARDLKSLKVLRSVTHPYVFIRSGLKTKKSEVHNKGMSAPEWTVEANFINVNEERYPTILFEVYDEGKWGLGDMFIGTTNLPIPLSTTFFEGWLHLNNGNTITGHIYVRCDCLVKVAPGVPVAQGSLNSNRSMTISSRGSQSGASNTSEMLQSNPRKRSSQCSIVSTGSNVSDTFVLARPIAPSIEIPVIEPNELQFLQNIGRGAQGSVDLHIYQGQRVAVKSFYNINASTGQSTFQKEVEIMYRLNSENMVRLLGVSEAMSKEPKIVMEYMDRGNLRQYLDAKKCQLMMQNSQHDLNSVLFIAVAIADGLRYLHRQRIVHRDLKPLNVLINSKNEVKLADFGISREDAYGESAMTIGAGTCLWMAPEVCNDNDYSVEADIYSLGVILTELETLERPYHDAKGGVFAIQTSICQGKLRPSLSKNCPEWYQALAAECMASDPVDRPTAAKVAKTLRLHLPE